MGNCIFVITGLAVIGLIITLAVKDAADWSEFKETHDCKIVSKTSSSTGFGVGVGSGVGSAIVTMQGKTGWLCDDGVVYNR